MDKNAKKHKNEKLLESITPDLDSIDWLGGKYTEKQKLFVYYYCLLGTPTYHNKSASAKMAGCKKDNSAVAGVYMYKKTQAIIENIEKNTKRTSLQDAIDSAYFSIQRREIDRATIPVANLYKMREHTTEDGATYKKIEQRPLDELTPSEKNLIDRVDYKGIDLLPVYVPCDQEKAMERVVSWYNEAHGGSGNDYDIQLTIDGIQKKLGVKMSTIDKNSALASNVIDTANVDKEE